MNHDEVLRRWIPYRLKAVDALNYAILLRSSWAAAPPMVMYVDGKQVVEGNLNAFTNPAIEAGLVHCRALLEFLGLCERDGKLSNRRGRKRDDIGIERFRTADGPLKMIDAVTVLDRYGGGREEAEAALSTIFRATNKGLAHITADLIDDPDRGRLTEIASRFIPWLVINDLYAPLGLEAPSYKITSRAPP